MVKLSSSFKGKISATEDNKATIKACHKPIKGERTKKTERKKAGERI